MTASDAVRWGSIIARDKQFVQTTEADIRDKGKMFPQRIRDTYLKYADEIEFYYRDAVDQNAILAGKWKDGKIELLDGVGQEDLMWNKVFPLTNSPAPSKLPL